MRHPLLVALLVTAAGDMASADEAAEARDPHAVVVLSGVGKSFALGTRRVANTAPPITEVRLARRLRRLPWLVPDASISLYVFPEAVPALGAGVRLHPLDGTPGARHLFVRAGAQALAALDGFDVALGGELGAAVERGRLIGWLAVSADRFFIGPRLVALARLGVGVTF